VFPTLAPGPDNIKVYCISSVGRGERYGREQERGRLNCKSWFRVVSTSFIIVRKILIMLGVVVTI
jgi:hypothetical protein